MAQTCICKTSGGDNIAVHNASVKTELAISCHLGDAILPGTNAQNSLTTRSTLHYVPNAQIQALSYGKMGISAALLDFRNAVRAEVFTDRLSDVSGTATRLCD